MDHGPNSCLHQNSRAQEINWMHQQKETSNGPVLVLCECCTYASLVLVLKWDWVVPMTCADRLGRTHDVCPKTTAPTQPSYNAPVPAWPNQHL